MYSDSLKYSNNNSRSLPEVISRFNIMPFHIVGGSGIYCSTGGASQKLIPFITVQTNKGEPPTPNKEIFIFIWSNKAVISTAGNYHYYYVTINREGWYSSKSISECKIRAWEVN